MSERSEEDIAHAEAMELTDADARYFELLDRLKKGETGIGIIPEALVYIMERLGAPSDGL